MNIPHTNYKRVVIVGCGFGGLKLAQKLNGKNFQVVLLDRNNYHTFQPLLYQVATAGLEADSIAYPIRKIFKGQSNLHFRWCDVLQVNTLDKSVHTSIGDLTYDYLVIATGSTTNFFGNEGFESNAMPMKTVTEALNLRSFILQKFEEALLEKDLEKQQALMTFAVVGGGPTGVELAGALCELKNHVLPNDYPELDFRRMRVLLIENSGELLSAMQPANRAKAATYLESLGCELWLNTGVASYDGHTVQLRNGKVLNSSGLIWAAGIKGVPVPGLPETSVTPRGRIIVDETCLVKGTDSVYAIGDVAQMSQANYPNGHPQIAPVAIQQAELVADNFLAVQQGKNTSTFTYRDKGVMATVGRNRAVVEAAGLRFGGFAGWLTWMALHLMLLVGFRNKVVVFINWLWNYINYDRNIRLIIRPFKRSS